MLLVSTSGVKSTQLCVDVKHPVVRTGKTLVSHGVEACPHVRKVLFRVQVSPFLPGANPRRKQRRAGRPRKGTRVSTPRGGSRKGLEYA